MPSPSTPPSGLGPVAPGPRLAHFRAHERRSVQLSAGLVGQAQGPARQVSIIDVSLAGAGLLTNEPLLLGERLEVSFTTPTLRDPLTLRAVVAWVQPPQADGEVDALGGPRSTARAGVAFEYPNPLTILAMFELLASLGNE